MQTGDARDIMAHRGTTFEDLERLRRELEDELKNGLPSRREAHLRALCLFYFLRDTALRASEVLSLNMAKRVRTEDGRDGFTFLRLKKRKPTNGLAVPGPMALRLLADYHALIGRVDTALFYSLPDWRGRRQPLSYRTLHRMVRGWAQRYGIAIRGDRKNTRTGRPTRELNPHAFRHTSLQKVAQARGAETARQLAGHSDIRTTRAYLRQWVYTADVWDE